MPTHPLKTLRQSLDLMSLQTSQTYPYRGENIWQRFQKPNNMKKLGQLY